MSNEAKRHFIEWIKEKEGGQWLQTLFVLTGQSKPVVMRMLKQLYLTLPDTKALREVDTRLSRREQDDTVKSVFDSLKENEHGPFCDGKIPGRRPKGKNRVKENRLSTELVFINVKVHIPGNKREGQSLLNLPLVYERQLRLLFSQNKIKNYSEPGDLEIQFIKKVAEEIKYSQLFGNQKAIPCSQLWLPKKLKGLYTDKAKDISLNIPKVGINPVSNLDEFNIAISGSVSEKTFLNYFSRWLKVVDNESLEKIGIYYRVNMRSLFPVFDLDKDNIRRNQPWSYYKKVI